MKNVLVVSIVLLAIAGTIFSILNMISVHRYGKDAHHYWQSDVILPLALLLCVIERIIK